MLLKFQRRGVPVVRPSASEQASSVFRVGDPIPTSGIYRAVHGDHRLAHDITLLSGDVFPRCSKCGETVIFELLAAAPAGLHDSDFRVRLYVIPHPEVFEDAREIA